MLWMTDFDPPAPDPVSDQGLTFSCRFHKDFIPNRKK
jgi:hypothetical protein